MNRKSQVGSGDGKNNSNQSRITDHTSNRNNDSHINGSFSVDNSVIDASLDQQTNNRSSIKNKAVERKHQIMESQFIKRHYLTKVLLNTMINVRTGLQAMNALPRPLFKKGASLDIAQALIMKTKINLETSLLRSLFYSADFKKQQSKLQLKTTTNAFVIPTPEPNYSPEKEAILTLSQHLKDTIKHCLRQFKANKERTLALKSYLTKIYTNYTLAHATAYQAIKNVPSKQKKGTLDEGAIQLFRMSSQVEKWEHQKNKQLFEAFSAIKLESTRVRLEYKHAAKTILFYAQLRKEATFKHWKQTAYDCRAKKQKVFKASEEKLTAVRRIMMRNYLKLFREISRRIFSYQRVAVRLGCSSRLNEQKALWRLMLNMYNY